ncbi:AmmeMemoRadiSam system protein A [Verrucomicrobiota bacterium]
MKNTLIVLTIFAFFVGYTTASESKTNTVLSAQDKTYLLDLARQTVCWHLKYKTTPTPDKNKLSKNVQKKLGCFVTLEHKQKGLRGCIGIFERSQPLYKNVISRAIAACHDGRFRSDPVTYEMLKDIKIEISVLTEPKDLSFDSTEDLLKKLRPMIDGVILYTRYGNSTYLPQVWEQLPKKEDFLSYLCRKHGAPMDTWKKGPKNVRIQTYQAIVLHEESSPRKAVGPKGAIMSKEGTKLEPGTIVSWDSELKELE